MLRLIHKLPVDDAKEGVHHQEEDELPTDEFVQGALVTEICENTTDRLSLCKKQPFLATRLPGAAMEENIG